MVDIFIHANNIKSSFHKVKLHPNIMGAFSYILADELYLPCRQPFGTDFSLSNLVVHQVLEYLPTLPYQDKTLQAKYWNFLDKLTWDRSLTCHTGTYRFTKVHWDALNAAVVDAGRAALPTAHFIYVDDDIYVDIFSVPDFKQCIAASIEAIWILFRSSDLLHHRDPISFDKLTKMMIGPINKALGYVVNTQCMPLPHF